MSDPVLWCRYFLHIVNKNGQYVPFVLNPQQADLVQNLQKFNVILKSRQLGITCAACALSLYYCHTSPNTTCLLMSYSLDSAKAIFEKLKSLWQSIPPAIRQKELANNRSELKFANNSRIVVCTCGSKDIARGMSLTFAHLSEFAFFDSSRAQKMLLGLEQSMLPNGRIIIESTANGFNAFSDIWQKAEQGENLYAPHFYGWIEDRIMFADEQKQFCQRWIERHGALPSVDDLDDEEKALYDKGATISQLTWRRLKVSNSSIGEFRQEFPSCPTEAFVTSGRCIFDTKMIDERAPFIPKPIAAPPEFSGISHLKFWELPRPESRYYIGCDVAEGTGGDHSAIEILSRDGFQCAELFDNRISPARLTEVLLKLAYYYNRALLIIEKASSGHTVLDRIKTARYSNVYKSKMYDSSGQIRKKIGWQTTAKSRPILISDFRDAFSKSEICINSPVLLGEMARFVDKDGRMEHSGRTGDDTVMAFAMAMQGAKSGIWYLSRGVKNMTKDEVLEIPQTRESVYMLSQNLRTHRFLLGQHKVLQRPDFAFKSETLSTAKIVLQNVLPVLDFHASFLIGNPVSLTGDSSAVKAIQHVYNRSNYPLIDYRICDTLTKYGNAFEYVYSDGKRILSKVFNPLDCYPVYDDKGVYTAFLEHWTDVQSGVSYYNLYEPDTVTEYSTESGTFQMIAQYRNPTGLPIHYKSGTPADFDCYGRGLVVDLIPIVDEAESLLSRCADAVYTLSLNPLGVASGARIDSAIDRDLIGVTLSLEDGAKFSFANATIDSATVKFLIEQLTRNFYAVASVPAVVFNSGNAANLSETSLKLLFSQADARAKRTALQLREGFYRRWDYMRALLPPDTFTDDAFDSLDCQFNLNRPTDSSAIVADLVKQYEAGALSRQSFIELSPYTSDPEQEQKRLAEEGNHAE